MYYYENDMKNNATMQCQDDLAIVNKCHSTCMLSISGDGYCRSEGIVAIYLQKHKDAKRIYSTIVHSKTNSDGNKEQGKYNAWRQ